MQRDLDSVAFTSDTDPSQGVHLTFNSQPPFVPDINLHGFNVPVDGTSWNGAMYVFYTTDSYQIDGDTLMGRSVLVRSTDEGYNFVDLGEFSRKKFKSCMVVNPSTTQVVQECSVTVTKASDRCWAQPIDLSYTSTVFSLRRDDLERQAATVALAMILRYELKSRGKI